MLQVLFFRAISGRSQYILGVVTEFTIFAFQQPSTRDSAARHDLGKITFTYVVGGGARPM